MSMRLCIICCVALGLAASVACTPNNVRVWPETTLTKRAVEFATALGTGEYQRAHAFLSSSLRSRISVAKLETDYKEMVSYGSGAPTTVTAVTAMDNWPDKQAGDLEWVYVAMANDTYSEAVTVVVAQENDELVIRSIEWGRP